MGVWALIVQMGWCFFCQCVCFCYLSLHHKIQKIVGNNEVDNGHSEFYVMVGTVLPCADKQ